MPLQLDGQLTLTPLPTAGPSGMKRAMLVRLSEDSLDALSADLASGKYPQVHVEFDGTPVITIGDQAFPLAATREQYEHELYRRAINTRTPSGLRMFGNVMGAFRVQHQDVSARAQEKLRSRTLAAEQKKSERHTLYIDEAVDPKTAVNGKRKKANASLGDKAVNRLATTKEGRTASTSTSNPSHAGASSSSILATTRIAPSRAAEVEHPPRPSLPAARPKLAKNAGAPPPRSTRDGEILTSTFRGGILTKDAKKPAAKAAKDKPSAADNPAPKASSSKAKLAARDWDGEPDDLPLAITTRTAGVGKTANGNARSSLPGSSTSTVARSRDSASGLPPAKAREPANGTPTKKAVNGQSSSAPTAAMALANAIAAASSSSSTSAAATAKKLAQPDSAKRKRALDDDDDDYLGPGVKKPALKSAQKGAQKSASKSAQDSPPAAKRKRPTDDDEFTVGPSRKSVASEAGTIKRKRALANDDDEYEGPGVAKKRKSVATSAPSLTAERTTASRPALNGTAKKLTATTTKKEPSRSPNLAPPQPVAPPPAPPVTRLPRANDEPTLAKSLRFTKKETKVEKVEKVEIATPNTSASSISVKTETPANGLSRRRSTPTFTSTEDEEEAEEGELRPARPAKKSKDAHSRKPAPSKKAVSTWRPEPLPSDHAKLRSRYHATYVEYSSDLLLFAQQRAVLNRRLEQPDGATADSDSEILGEEELEKVKLKHAQVVDELNQIRKLLETPAPKVAS